ncbi:MAG: methyltransferase domain-containing protein [Methylotenera sp.]|nr:methyltransferase domain-containing protein [Oligoflexia bacterium]
MSYVLENRAEAERLESQSRLRNYLPEQEIENLQLAPGMRLLDAGCGTGLLSRILKDRCEEAVIEACDGSVIRVHQARELSCALKHQDIQFFESRLEAIPRPDNHYDWVVARYVYEHLENVNAVTHELLRVLKPGGRIRIIDFDGIVFNLGHQNPELAQMLEQLRVALRFDLFIGRKIPGILVNGGFRDCTWTSTIVDFQGQDLHDEIEQTKQRFNFSMPLFSEIFGSRARALSFCEIYLAEMHKPGCSLFYNKFVVSARK